MRNPQIIMLIIFFLIETKISYGLDLDYPTSGMGFNNKESSSLEWHCKKLSSIEISCDFVQLSVRKKLNKNEYEKAIKNLSEDFKKEKKEKDPCLEIYTQTSSYIDLIDGKRAPNNEKEKEELSKLNTRTREYIRKTLVDFIRYCKTPTLENYTTFMSNELKKNFSTCLVSSTTFNQEFTKLNSSADMPVWVVKSPQPSDSCGIVRLDKFDLVRSSVSNINFWNYTAKKVITNPKGEGLLIPCDKLDESVHIFEWNSKPHNFMGCEHIEFSPF